MASCSDDLLALLVTEMLVLLSRPVTAVNHKKKQELVAAGLSWAIGR
jgi:hypothetical protein